MSSAEFRDTYRQVQLIRVGHPCEIWAVRRERDHARLAMKLVPAGSEHTRQHIAAIRHEYSVGIKLDHENIARMYDVGKSAIGSYLIMELCDYPNLKQRIQLGVGLFAHQAESIILQAGRALAHLHEQGFLHRDIKPDNYLVSDEGVVKLIDFNLAERKKTGLAKMFAGKNKIQGTMSYMSPEQIRAKTVDERTDIYSYGCMLFEILTGKLPFTGMNSNDLLSKHLRADRPPLEPYNSNVTREFSLLVRRMMAISQSERPSTMAEVLDLLSSTPVLRVRPQAPSAAPSSSKEAGE